jgi:hypothetical protein
MWVGFFVSSWAFAFVFIVDVTSVIIDAVDVVAATAAAAAAGAAASQPSTDTNRRTCCILATNMTATLLSGRR